MKFGIQFSPQDPPDGRNLTRRWREVLAAGQLAEEVARANEDLPESVRVRRFVLLHKQFDPDDDEITRTRKVRRRVINERYAAIIDALVEGAAEVEIKSVVTYQDGSNVTRTITLQIVSMDGYTPKQAGARRTLFGSHA